MSEKEDCVFIGTPIDTAESALFSRKQPRTSRAPRVWEQIVTDDRGRRRLHGAFTGGFSAGYFNTVSTKVTGSSKSSDLNALLGRICPSDFCHVSKSTSRRTPTIRSRFL